MSVRAKFFVSKIEEYASPVGSKKVFLSAVMNGKDGKACEENKSFAKYTPSGELFMMIDNPVAAEQFKAGQEFYIDFTRAE